MKAHEAEKLIETIRGFIERPRAADTRPMTAEELDNMKKAPMVPVPKVGGQPATPFDEEALYQRFRARFIDEAAIDPTLVHLMLARPEIIVGYERKVERLDGSTLKGRVARLVSSGWLNGTPRATGAIRKELARTGADPGGGGTLSDTLSGLQRAGFLTREGEGWVKAVGVKITEEAIEA